MPKIGVFKLSLRCYFVKILSCSDTCFQTTPNQLAYAIKCALFGLVFLPVFVHANTEKNPATHQNSDTVIDNVAAVEYYSSQPKSESKTQQSDQLTTKQDVSPDTQSDAQTKQKPSPVAHLVNLKESQPNRSLKKLSEYYQTTPNTSARCQGSWIAPKNTQIAAFDDTDKHGDYFYAQADYGYWDAQDYAELSGNVIVEQNGRQVSADKILIDTSTGQAKASGQVQFSDTHSSDTKGLGLIAVAESLEYRDNDTATAQDVAFASSTVNAHGYAKELNKTSEHHYQMKEVMFSTCPPMQRKWHLDSQRIDIDNSTGRAAAHNSTLRMGGIPILYVPYLNFPIDDRRHSGFLLPTVGFGSTGNLTLSTPYYFNLAPNYDATLTPSIFTNRNPMISGEFRYLTNHLGQGDLTVSYLPKDQKYHHKTRQRIRYNHTWNSNHIKNLNGYVQYQYVSDADYLSDFDILGTQTRSLNLPRRLGVSYANEHLHADLRFEGFQRLYGKNSDGTLILDKDRPYSRLPQLSVSYQVPAHWLNFDKRLSILGMHNATYFKKSIRDDSQAEKSGVRIYNQLVANYPLTSSWGYIKPKLTLSHLYTSYDQDSLAGQNLSKSEGSYSIFVPQFSVDTGLILEKKGSPLKKFSHGTQILSPRLKYTYTPYKNQDSLPNFETSVAQIGYNQLFLDSWFLGYDRIQDLHAITPAINYRYIDTQGRTRFDGSVATQILLRKPRVDIDNAIFSNQTSGTAWQMSVHPYDYLWVDAAGAFRGDYKPNSLTAQLRYQPTAQKLFSFGVVDRKSNKETNQLPLSAYTASMVLPIANRWQLLGQAQYDYKHHRLLDALFGFNYEDCCYGISLYTRHYRDNLNTQNRINSAVMAEIRLNGIGDSNSKLAGVLRSKIIGYDQVKQAWDQNK